MSVIEHVKAKALEMRKSKNALASAMQFAVSEIEKIGKNSGNRETTDSEAIRAIRKMIANIDQNLSLQIDDGRRVALSHERNILESFIPAQISPFVVAGAITDWATINGIDLNSPKSKGAVSKEVRARYGDSVDLKEVMKHIYG